MRIALAIVACLLAAAAARAAPVEDTLAAWYDALQSSDKARLDAMLAPDATVVITDLDIIQNRSEFLESLDEWEDAIAGGSIRHRIETGNPANASVLVCYAFPNNDALVRETFTFNGDLVATWTQSAVADNCTTF